MKAFTHIRAFASLALVGVAIALTVVTPGIVQAAGGPGGNGGHVAGPREAPGHFDGHRGFDGRHEFRRGPHDRLFFGGVYPYYPYVPYALYDDGGSAYDD